MANANQDVTVINEKESMQKLLEKYTDDDLRIILRYPQSSIEFCGELLNSFVEDFAATASKTLVQIWWEDTKSLSNFGHLKHFIDMLKPARNDLLKSLEANANYIEQHVKIGLYMKVLGSVGNIAGTVGDFFLRDSSSDYSIWAFTADVLGFMSDAAPMGEVYLSDNAYDDIVNKLQRDQTLFAPIYTWFQQTRELEDAMQNIFPFDVKEIYLRLLYEAADSELRGAELLARVFRKVTGNVIERLRDRRFVESVTHLVASSLIEEFIEWLRFHPDEIQYNIPRTSRRFTIDSILKVSCRQLASRLPSKHQKSCLVLPRIGWNVWSILQAFRSLRMSELSEVAAEMRRIKKHLSEEMATLERIAGYIEIKRNEQIQ